MAVYYTLGTVDPTAEQTGAYAGGAGQQPFIARQTQLYNAPGDNYVYDSNGSVGKINANGSIEFLPGWSSDGGDEAGNVNIFSSQKDADGNSVLAATVDGKTVNTTPATPAIAKYMEGVQRSEVASRGGGFLDTVMAVATNPATIIAVVAIIVAPELAPAIGAELGFAAGSTAATAAGYGAIGAGTGAVTAAAQGANGTEIAKAALIGGAAGAAGGAITAEASGLVPELGKTGAAAVGGAAKGGIQAGLTGGSVGSSAAGGALGSALGTEIGGTTGNVLGGAAGSATGAQLAGGDPTKSAIYGGIQGAFSGLGKTMFNPQTGQQVAYDPQTTQLAQNQGTVTIGSPQVNTDAPTGTDLFTPLPPGVMYNPDINQYTYADGRIYQPTLNEEPSNNLFLTGTSQYPTYTADYSGGGSKSNTLLGGPLGTQTTSPLSAGTLDVTGKQTSTIDQGGTTQKGQASPSDKPQLITPTIVPSSGGQSPQVLSSVLGAPSSSILGQALQSSNPDPATTGNPVFEGDGKNKRNVWNTESLRTALGLS
jgi:hypothetical protein